MGQYAEIIMGALGVVIVIASTIWVRWAKAKALLKELSEALVCLSNAIEDNKFTREELEKLAEEFGDVIIVAGNLFKKG